MKKKYKRLSKTKKTIPVKYIIILYICLLIFICIGYSKLKTKLEIGGMVKVESKNTTGGMDIFKNEEITMNGLTVKVSSDGIVTINGRASNKAFIKISNGLSMVNDGNQLSTFIPTEPIIRENEEVTQKIYMLDGTATPSGNQVNLLFRSKDNEALEERKSIFTKYKFQCK